MAALCTFVVMVMNCSAVSDVWIWLAECAQLGWSDDVPVSGSSSAQLQLKSSSTSLQVPLKFRLCNYYSSTYLRRLPGIMSYMFPPSPCLLDRLARRIPLMYCVADTVGADTDVAC